MDLRARISEALTQAKKGQTKERLQTLRLINAAIKDHDTAMRSRGKDAIAGNDEIMAILGKMTRQRQESARAFEEGGRLDLAERELREITVVEEFLPHRMDEDEIQRAIQTVLADLGAGSIRDMGRVMGELKSRHAGQMDFSKVGKIVQSWLCAATRNRE